MSLADEQYVSLTTFRKAGTPVPTALWVVGLDGARLGFWTSGDSGKVKRVRSTPRVTVQACDRRGRAAPAAPVASGTARLASPAEQAEIMRRVVAKYGLMARLIMLGGSVRDRFRPAARRVDDVAIVVELTGSA
jgi:PPOX class probable F420-dependent enzyme